MLRARNLEKQERMKSLMMLIIRAYFRTTSDKIHKREGIAPSIWLFFLRGDIIQSWSFASSKVTPISVPIRPPAKEQIRANT